jgi:hypothetical protein
VAKKDKGRKKDGDEQQDATRGDRKGRQYRYDEERPSAPEHRYPGATTVRHAAHPGATARLLLEGAMRAIGGFSVADFDRLGVDTRDLVPHLNLLLSARLRSDRRPSPPRPMPQSLE